MLHQHQHSQHQHQQVKKREPTPTRTTVFIDNHQLSFNLLLHSLEVRSHRLLKPARVRKLDSVAGATGTSISSLPGRHILVPPWASIVVYSVILSFLILTGAGFVLSWNARREFRRRVADQKAADALNQPAAPISRKDIKSFTRQSIIQLNSSRNPSTYAPPFRISRAGDLLPINVFDRPTRYSMVVAEVDPSLAKTETDDFYRFSQTAQRTSFWESRKSRAISLSHLAVPQLEITPHDHDQSTELAEVLDGVSWDRNRHSTFTRTPVRRDPSTSSSAPTNHIPHNPPPLVPVVLEDTPYNPPQRSTSLTKHPSPSSAGRQTQNPRNLSGQPFQMSRGDSEGSSHTHTPTYGLSPTPSYVMRVPESNSDPDQAMAEYATNLQRPSSPWTSNSSMGHSSNAATASPRSASPLNISKKLSKRLLQRPSNTLRSDSGDGSTRSQTPSSINKPHLPSINTLEMRVPEPNSTPADPDKAMAEYAINRKTSASTTPNPNKGLRMLAKLDEVGFTMIGLDDFPMVTSPISHSSSSGSLPFQSGLNPSTSMTRKLSVKNLPLIPEQSLSKPRPTLDRSGSSRRKPSLPTSGSSTLPPAQSLIQRSASARVVHLHQRRPMLLESIEETHAKSNHRRSVSLNGLPPRMIPINNTRVRRSPSSSNTPVMVEKVTGNSGVRRPPPRIPLSGTMSSGGVRNSSFVP
ncbi:hypothetical protein DFH28DRAFT_1053725 [Melampsora americana]|nr:hypothetical protein DFH28DRAFT_1053725 [Melampsora americana]